MAVFRISGFWHVGWWNLITSVRLIQVGNNRHDYFRYILGVRVRLIKVSFKVNKGNKFRDFGSLREHPFLLALRRWGRFAKRPRRRRARTLIVQSYFDTLLPYVLSLTFCGTVVMKVMDQKTLVKHRWSYKVRITMYILTASEFCQTRLHKSLIGNLARHFLIFSFFDRTKTRPQTSKTSEWFNGQLITSRTMDDYRNSLITKFCAELFPAHRCPSVIKFKIRLECASVIWSDVLLISKASFPANKMN